MACKSFEIEYISSIGESMPVAQRANNASFEKIWATLDRITESQKETDLITKDNALQMKEFRESQKETDRQIKESQEKTEKSINALTEQMGGLHNKFGAIAEHLVGPGIVERFNNLGYHFDGIADRGFKILDDKGNLKTEIDILLENGDYIVVVEVKADVRIKDIEHHVKRLEILRQYRNKHNDPRKIRGAIAGAIFYPNIKEMALENGFYVLEQSGDTMKMDLPEWFKPKEW